MSDYRFTVLDVAAEPYAVSPQLTARLRIEETIGERVHAIALRCQVPIEPQRLPYEPAEQERLLGLFGQRGRWAQPSNRSSGCSARQPCRVSATHRGRLPVAVHVRPRGDRRSLLADADVAFRSATERFDTSTPVGRMLVQMLGVFAEFEREVIIDRVIAGMERKAAKGLWNGGPISIGYLKDAKTGNLAIVAVQAAIVQRIFDL